MQRLSARQEVLAANSLVFAGVHTGVNFDVCRLPHGLFLNLLQRARLRKVCWCTSNSSHSLVVGTGSSAEDALAATKALKELASAVRNEPQGVRLAQARSARVRQLVQALQLGVEEHVQGGGQQSAPWRRVPLEHLGAEGICAAMDSLSVLGGSQRYEVELEALVQGLDLARRLPTREQLARVMWALANARHRTERMPALERAAGQLGGLAAWRPRQAASLLWALAVLRGDASELLSRTSEEAFRSALRSYSAKELATAAWALALLDMRLAAPFLAAWAEVGRRARSSGMAALPGSALRQIHQVQLLVELNADERVPPFGAGGQELLARAKAAWDRELSRHKGRKPSQNQREVCSALTSMGLAYVCEDVCSGLSVDVSVPSHRLAIELDGDSHFCWQPGQRERTWETGPTAFKRYLLHRHGWVVLPITLGDWDLGAGQLSGSERLRRLIRRRVEELDARGQGADLGLAAQQAEAWG